MDAAAAAESPLQTQQQQQPSSSTPQQPRPVVLILVGIPGSGKSTFSAALKAHARAARWCIVNQDTCSPSGARGTRQQCVAAAHRALYDGDCVVVDRCNVDAQQRRDFLALARAHNAPAFALVLALPRTLCIARAAARTGHPGGVEGAGAARVVNMMAARLAKPGGLPAPGEGFSSIVAAKNDADVAAALDLWAGYGEPGWRGPPALPAARAVAAAAAAGLSAANPPAPKKAKPRDESAVGEAAGGVSAGGAAAAAAAGGGAAAAAAPATATATATPEASPTAGGVGSGGGGAGGPPRSNAFAVLMAGARAKAAATAAAAAGASQSHPAAQPPPPGSPQQQQHPKPGGFVNVLADVATNPDAHRGSQRVLYVDDLVVAIEDKFAKARRHALVIARDPTLDAYWQLRAQHLPLLARMREVATRIISEDGGGGGGGSDSSSGGGEGLPNLDQQQQQQEGGAAAAAAAAKPPRGWAVGFHSAPSMRRLHLHVISTDLCSPALKTKRHYNSFATAFFVPLHEAAREVAAAGAPAPRGGEAAALELLKLPLRCNRCGAGAVNMPALKAHLVSCDAPLP